MYDKEKDIVGLIEKLREGKEGIWQYAAVNLGKKGKKATPFLISAIKSNSYDSEKWNAVGIEFLLQKKYKEAEQLFYELLKKEDGPVKGRNLNNLGLSFLGQRKAKKAIEVFLEAFEFDINKDGIKAAKKLPAWYNLNFALSISRMKRTPPIKIGGDLRPEMIGPLAKIVLEEVIGGGFIAASLIYLIMLVVKYYPDVSIFGIKLEFIIPIIMLFGGISFLYIYLRYKYK